MCQLGHLTPQFLHWLEKLIAPNPQQRYPDAQTALNALEHLDTAAPMRCKPSIALQRFSLSAMTILATLGVTHHLLKPAPIIPVPPDLSPEAALQMKIQSQRGCPGCNLTGANLKGMNLQSYDFSGANLQGADLRHADLRGASFREANLTNTLLWGANTGSTDFSNAHLPDGINTR